MEIELKEGEALTAEQIKQLAEEVKLAKEFKTKYELSETEKAGLVEELKEEKRKKQEAKDLADAALAQNGDPDAKIRTTVETLLNAEKTKQIETSRAQFEESFKASNPEFEPSNDPSGIKFQTFKKILGRFNLSGLSTVSEFAEVYKDSMLILKREEPKTNSQSLNQNSFTPGTRSSSAQTVDNSGLTSQEEKLIESVGWTKEKYLKLKASQPAFVGSLLSKVRD